MLKVGNILMVQQKLGTIIEIDCSKDIFLADLLLNRGVNGGWVEWAIAHPGVTLYYYSPSGQHPALDSYLRPCLI
jgi:hypothetical protein